MINAIILLSTIYCAEIGNKTIDFDTGKCVEIINDCLLDDAPEFCLDAESYEDIRSAYES